MVKKPKILIVDDEPKNVDILDFILSDIYDVVSVDNGEKAMEMVHLFRPDIVLLDIMMPGIDGYEVCEWIKSTSEHVFTKVILVSGKAMVEERLQGYESGADDYITKPFDPDELLAKVKVFLRLKNTEEVDHIKGTFLSLVSHEANTPLNGIIGLSELLMTSENLNSNESELVQMIHDSGWRLYDFLDRVRLLCDLKAGSSLMVSTEPLLPVIDNALLNAKEKYEKTVDFDIAVPQNLTLDLDWGLICKILEYLIDNAIKHSPDDGSVFISAEVAGGVCKISVADQGDGIKDDIEASIFNEFTVSDVAHHSKGAGLSLAIVKMVVKLHRGRVEVCCDGKTTFTISLPLEQTAIAG